jgi:methyl-accepting chemotaxis protein
MRQTNSKVVISAGSPGTSRSPGRQAGELDFEDIELVSRFLLGLLIFGGEELLSRLRTAQQRIEASRDLVAVDVVPDDESMTDLLGYLTLGMFVRGQKRLARRIDRGIRFTMSTAGWALGTLNRLTDNRLARPFRQPIEQRMFELVMEGQQVIYEGRREVHASRMLATKTVDETIDEVVQILAENPEVTAAIQQVIAGQGAGLTGTVVGNARHLGMSADDLAETMARRLLRRKPRRELPPSPLAGKPQTMYGTGVPSPGAEDDGR